MVFQFCQQGGGGTRSVSQGRQRRDNPQRQRLLIGIQKRPGGFGAADLPAEQPGRAFVLFEMETFLNARGVKGERLFDAQRHLLHRRARNQILLLGEQTVRPFRQYHDAGSQ
ncbi:hypothetical protein D3C86_1658840 [compost metagenome]